MLPFKKGERLLRLPGVLAIASALFAQIDGPGLVKGKLLELETGENTGELVVRAGDNRVFRFLFDPKTYFERDKHRIQAGDLKKGESIEVVSDHAAGMSLRYARTVHVLEEPVSLRPAMSAARLRALRNVTEHIVPRGNLTFSGLVLRLAPDRLVLRTRVDGDKTIMLRTDTKYMEDGALVEMASLRPNLRVFVRGGRNLDNELEAYQVVWGQILSTK